MLQWNIRHASCFTVAAGVSIYAYFISLKMEDLCYETVFSSKREEETTTTLILNRLMDSQWQSIKMNQFADLIPDKYHHIYTYMDQIYM